MSLEDLIRAAGGKRRADLLLRNARVVNVFSGEIIPGDLAVYGGKVCGMGSYRAEEIIDLENRLLLPGYIDGHLHIESSMVTVPEFAEAVVPLGTTTVIIDPHEIANVLGLDGIRYMLESSKHQPLDVFLMLPSCVPATELETSGAVITAGDIFPYLSEKWVAGLGEVMNFPGVIDCRGGVLDKLKLIRGKKIDGHAPGVSGKKLNAYVSAGIRSDHESTTLEEAREKLRAGMHVMIREGTATRNLLDLIPLVDEKNWVNFSFVSDDTSPEELLKNGHMNHIVGKALNAGLDPVTAVRLGSINTARYFGLDGYGAVAPGFNASFQVLESFESRVPDMVFKNGRLIAEKGKLLRKKKRKKDTHIRGSVNVRWLTPDDFKVKVKGEKVRVIKLIPGQIITGSAYYKTPSLNGYLVSDTSRDLLKTCVVERHRASGRIGTAMVKGLGLREGAIATSVAHDSHNIVSAGVSDEDIMCACVEVVKMGGGLAAVRNGKVLEKLPLPVAGLMSPMPVKKVNARLKRVVEAAHQLGAVPEHPFFTLSFISLPVIPELKVTDRGLVEASNMKITELFR